MEGEALATILAAGIAIIVIGLVVLIAYAVYYYIGLWKLFKKAGRPGWNAIIPFYNDFVLVEMVGLHWYWFIISLIPTVIGLFVDSGIVSNLLWVVSLLVNINIYYNLTKKMNKEPLWVVVLALFGPIILPILGYNKDEWYADAPVSSNGLFGSLGTNNAQSTQPEQAVTPSQEQVNSSSPTDGNNNMM